jgi:hypothetical protein
MQSKAELLAIKAKRKAQRQAATQAPAQRPLEPPSKAPNNNIESISAHQPPETQARAPAQHQLALESAAVDSTTQQNPKTQKDSAPAPLRPSQSHPTAAVKGADGASALPKGFFDDKKSDAIAQGEKPRTAADAEKDLQAFQREVEQLEEKQRAVAAEEADEAAERAAAQEAFEDKYESVLLCISCCKFSHAYVSLVNLGHLYLPLTLPLSEVAHVAQ